MIFSEIPERLRTLRDFIFTGRGRNRELHLQRLFPSETVALRGIFCSHEKTEGLQTF